MTLTVDDIKKHLNLSVDDSSDDELIAHKIAAAINFTEAYTGEPAAAYASGSITFGASPMAAGASISIGGVPYTAVDAPADAPHEFQIGANPAQTAHNFAAAIVRPSGVAWFPLATATGDTVTLVATDTDTAANTLSLATTSPAVTLSGPSLTGGLTPLPAVAEAVRRIAAHMYENREAVIVGASVSELPLGVWDLLTPFRKWGF